MDLSWTIKKAAAAKSFQSCLTLCDPIGGSPPGSRPWDSLGKNAGVGCHFLLQCMKVKSQSEVAQSCPTLSDPTDCGPQGSSVHGIFQARVLEWGAIAVSVSAEKLMLLDSVLEKTLESPLDCKEIQPVHPKGNQSWIFTGSNDVEVPILWPPDVKNWLSCKDPERLKAEGDDRGWDGWMASPTQWTWVSVNSRSWWWTREAWHAVVHGVPKSWTGLRDWTIHIIIKIWYFPKMTTTSISHALPTTWQWHSSHLELGSVEWASDYRNDITSIPKLSPIKDNKASICFP